MKHHLRRAALYILIPLLFAYILFSALSMAMPGDSALIVGGIIGLIFGIILVIQLDQKIRKIDEVRNANKGKPLKKWEKFYSVSPDETIFRHDEKTETISGDAQNLVARINSASKKN